MPKIFKLVITSCILSLSISCNSQKQTTAEFFIKYKANDIPYKILFVKPNESGYDNSSDTTISIRYFEKLTDTVLIGNGTASFSFKFYKTDNPSNYKTIGFNIEKNFTLSPKEYKIADFDLDKPLSSELKDSYDGLAGYNTKNGELFSWQYSWVKNHKPAKWTITKVDEQNKTISGKFSFTATQTESDGSTNIAKRNTFLKIVEVDLSEGEFHLPYTNVKY